MDPIVPPAILSVATLVSNLVGSVKNARDIANQSGDLELKSQINDILNSVVDVRIRVLELDGENRSLRDELKQKASVTRSPEFGYYFADGDPDPFCPNCYENADKLIHLPKPNPNENGIRRVCFVCSLTITEVPPVHNPPAGRWGRQY